MQKIDYKKELKYLYSPSAKAVEIVEVPEFSFVMIDGVIRAEDRPDTSKDFQDAIGALYGISYTLKFMSKLREVNPIDYTVMALEGLWGLEGRSEAFEINYGIPWSFTLMMLQPDHITRSMYLESIDRVRSKGENPALDKLRLERFHEGLCMQIMHIGPYSEEPATIGKMRAFARENDYQHRGRHHEIYLGDPRRAKPEKLKTILRQPIEKAT